MAVLKLTATNVMTQKNEDYKIDCTFSKSRMIQHEGLQEPTTRAYVS
jgi:hypothetical protein